MGLPFFDYPSIHRRLDSTICLYEGKPVYIRVPESNVPDDRPTRRRVARDSEHIVRAYHLPIRSSRLLTGAPMMVDYRDPRFSYKTLDLGYINAGNAVYLTRTPMRQQRQGLCQGVLYGYPHAPDEDNWFTSEAMNDCLLGKYPSQEEAERQLRSYAVGRVAISRTVAFGLRSDMIELLYKGRFIGHRARSASGFTLLETKEATALREVLKGDVCLK